VLGILVLEGQWLHQLYVEPTTTGRGIGAGLVTLAQRERPDGLRLWTFAANTAAQRFYERHGFVERVAPTAGTTRRARRTSSTCGAVQASRADHTGGAAAAVLSSLRQ
jgi:GNAT superfamily N-acetyltransferase